MSVVTTPVARAMPTYGGVASYPQVQSYPQVGYGAGFGAGFAAPVSYGAGFAAAPVDAARVEELKTTQLNQMTQHSEALRARVGQVQEQQVALIDAQADQQIQQITLTTNARREQQKAQLAQGATQQAYALDQRQLQATAQLEQQALAAQGLAARAQFGFGAPAVDAGRVEEMKAAQLGQVSQQTEAMKQHLMQLQQQQSTMVDARADQEIAMAVGQINARREQQKAQLTMGGQQQLMALDQRQAQSTAALEQQAMQLTAQARQQETMRVNAGSYVPPAGFGYGGLF
jgi:hypothetical protein